MGDHAVGPDQGDADEQVPRRAVAASAAGPLALVATAPADGAAGRRPSRASRWPAPASAARPARRARVPARTTATRSPAACSTTRSSRWCRGPGRAGAVAPPVQLGAAAAGTTASRASAAAAQHRRRLARCRGRGHAPGRHARDCVASPAAGVPGRRSRRQPAPRGERAADADGSSVPASTACGAEAVGRSAGIRTPPPARPPAAGGRRCAPAGHLAAQPRASGRPCPGWTARPGRTRSAAAAWCPGLGAEHARHVPGLVHADAVLAGDRPAVRDAEVEDRAGHLLGRARPRPAGVVEEDQRVQVAVAGVEDVGHPDAGARRTSSPMRAQHLRQRGARDHAVLDDVVGADPADRGERGLAPLPDQRPLGVVGGDPDLERAVVPAEPLDLGRTARSTSAAGPSSSTMSTAPGAGRVAAVHGRLGGLDGQRVHHLDRRRHHPGAR